MIEKTFSELETVAFARAFAPRLNKGDTVLLHGDLGAGKSVFARALIRVLCGDFELDVPSPTYTLVQSYDGARGPIWHFDLYRLEAPEDVYETGWEEAIGQGIVIIEWPERLGGLKPRKAIDIHIVAGHDNPDERRIEIKDETR